MTSSGASGMEWQELVLMLQKKKFNYAQNLPKWKNIEKKYQFWCIRGRMQQNWYFFFNIYPFWKVLSLLTKTLFFDKLWPVLVHPVWNHKNWCWCFKKIVFKLCSEPSKMEKYWKKNTSSGASAVGCSRTGSGASAVGCSRTGNFFFNIYPFWKVLSLLTKTLFFDK